MSSFRPIYTFQTARLLLFTTPHFSFSSPAISGQYQRPLQKLMPFSTDTPAKSSRHQRGLFHKKTHGRRFQRCFSMKKSIVTMQPNIKSRTLRSDILDQSF
ncbi:MAG: hypothetical protein ACK56F_19040 [bacterium]